MFRLCITRLFLLVLTLFALLKITIGYVLIPEIRLYLRVLEYKYVFSYISWHISVVKIKSVPQCKCHSLNNIYILFLVEIFFNYCMKTCWILVMIHRVHFPDFQSFPIHYEQDYDCIDSNILGLKQNLLLQRIRFLGILSVGWRKLFNCYSWQLK